MNARNKFFIKKLINNILSIFSSKIITRIFFNSHLVLMYHRVVPDKEYDYSINPNFGLSVSLSSFEKQIKFLSDNYNIVSINDLLNKSNNTKNSNKIIITFDDGYKDNLIYALPVLEKYNVPATIYCTSRFIEGESWTWWYGLWDYIYQNNSISLYIVNKKYFYKFHYLNDKFLAYKKISKLLKNLNYLEQKKIMLQILDFKKLEKYTDLFLNWNDLIKLKSSPLITIGAHTISHPSLAYLSDAEALEEIQASKKIIEEKINKKVLHFAYPYGTKSDFER